MMAVGRMSGWRVWGVQCLAVIVIGGSLYDIIQGNEHWPFSNYRLYASVERERSLTLTWLFGVPEDEPTREISLLGPQYIHPFNYARLMNAFRKMDVEWEPPELLTDGLLNCLLRYERLRQAGRHTGPKLLALRLYRLHWTLDPWARNVDHPDTRELLREASWPAGGPR